MRKGASGLRPTTVLFGSIALSEHRFTAAGFSLSRTFDSSLPDDSLTSKVLQSAYHTKQEWSVNGKPRSMTNKPEQSAECPGVVVTLTLAAAHLHSTMHERPNQCRTRPHPVSVCTPPRCNGTSNAKSSLFLDTVSSTATISRIQALAIFAMSSSSYCASWVNSSSTSGHGLCRSSPWSS
jgi:hypothetical protein